MSDNEQLVVLSCPWDHHHLWPSDLSPYPTECMAKVASLPSGEWPTCGKHLHVSRYITVNESDKEYPEDHSPYCPKTCDHPCHDAYDLEQERKRQEEEAN